jgi:hypothetical protein
MNRDTFIRRVLWASVIFNLGGASLFAFPSSALGQLAGMPGPVSPLYGYMLALFVVLFGGSYAWLALQKNIDRPLLAFGAIGKTCAFVLVLTFWLLGEVPARSVMAITGDLIFAGLFFWWLFGRPLERPAG